MSQQKNRRWWGIRTKTFFCLFAAFLFGCIALTFLVSKQINDRNEKQIRKDIGAIWDSTMVQIKQTMALNAEVYNEYAFKKLSTNVVSDLYGLGMRHVALYDSRGKIIMSTRNALFETEYVEDLNWAIMGKASYTIVRDNRKELIVYFSMPVNILNQGVGIVRYYIDYTDLMVSGRENANTILSITMVIFILTFLIITIFVINKIISPIKQLATISNQVTEDLITAKFDEKRYFSLVASTRKDELGDLTNNYRIMLQTVQNQLEKLQSDKNQIYELMENRKEFYDNVTHELKTPLTTINGYAQLLQTNGIEDQELFNRGIQNIMDESVRLHKMVIQLLEMSTVEHNRTLDTFDIVSLLRNVAETMELKARKYGSYISFSGAESLEILAYKDQVREVFVNVIDNAIKYGTNPQTIEIDVNYNLEWFEVSIANEGREITEEEVSHIFEPFYRVDKQLSREQGSAGLGLSICMKIMKEHGGDIRVRSKQGRTYFVIQFPCK